MIQFETVTAGPPAVTLLEAKMHLRVDHTLDDTLITAQIAAAQAHIESVLLWRNLTPATVRATFDRWDGAELWLPRPPVNSIVEITITDDGVPPVVIADTGYLLDGALGRVRFYGDGVNGGGAAGRIGVEYNAGYSAVPADLRAAVLLLLGHFYENRETIVVGAGVVAVTVPLAVEALCVPHRAIVPGGEKQ